MTYLKSFVQFLFFLFTLYGSAQDILVEKIDIEEGLSNSNVISITQDKDHFIWFCTKDGLNRFDSKNFTVFKTSTSEQNSISSNVLNFVYADRFDDVVWIGTEKNGVDAYNYNTHTFKHYEHDYQSPDVNQISANGITHIDSDPEGNIWFATYDGGIDMLNKADDTFINYNQANTPGLGSNYNWCVFYESEERVYAGHVNEGFSIINTKTNTAVHYKHDPNNPDSFPSNTVTHIFKDSNGRIWIGTREGLTLFDPVSERMLNFKHDPKNPNSLSNNFIQQTLETKDHKLYIATEGGGLNILDLKDLAINFKISDIHFKRIQESDTPYGLSSASVQTIFEDSFNNIWLGGLGSGINFISSNESPFHQISYLPYISNPNSLDSKWVESLCVDDNQNVWAANSAGGIAIFNKEKKIKRIPSINPDKASQHITSIYRGKTKIWAGTSDGEIYSYDSDFKRLSCFNDLPYTPIYCFLEDSKNNIWIATDRGLLRYNQTNQTGDIFTAENSKLSDDLIRTIAEDDKGNLWVGTLIGGLCVFDKDFNFIQNYGKTYDFYAVNSIFKDSQNRMWIGSQNDLFLIKDLEKDSVMRIGKMSGLAETNIKAITEGKTENEIWLSTINGLSKIELNTMHISNFDINDGIAYGEYLFGAVTKTAEGDIYFGSQNGITWFNENLETTTTEAPSPAITSVLAATNKNNLNQFRDIPFDENITLNHNENTFQIKFNILDYSLSDKAEFAYQMKGLDKGWFLVENEREVTFRNLKPGSYVFNLKSRIRNNEWSQQFKTLHITIMPPIWLSWWMKLIYLLLISALFIVGARFYKRKLKIENALILEKESRQQEFDLNEDKLKFFTNITHELRSPMTLILGPLEDLISENSLSEDQTKKLQMIQRIANRLLRIVNQILEFRKSENKSRKLSVIKDDLTHYIYEIGVKYKDLNQNKAIDVIIKEPKHKTEVFFDPNVVTIIMDNLLSNALKYTQHGSVTLDFNAYTEDNIDYTEVIVSDTGYGISETNLPHIFERYYQAKNVSHPIKGTGIGLALVKNMVELHEASIEVSSKLNKGTEFKIKFLTNNSYPDAIHYYPEEEEIEEDDKNVVLIVDDDQDIIQYIKDSLSDTYKIIAAQNGKVGLEEAKASIPDIIISDVMMPIMDGIEMCKHLKEDISTSHIPVVLLTAKVSLHDQKIGYDVGADSYLTKPFSSNLLKSRLKNIIDTRKQYSLTSVSKFKQKQQLLNESVGELDKEFLNKLTEVIEENLEDEKMNISYVAAQLNMSHSTLYRKIKALTDLTANEFIRKVRINYAEQLLISGQFNISEIMYQVGINSSSYFRQCFKDEFGMNPSEYLQKLKNN
ncbi:hybrid sensor histidine kinase/response regulator transcription factor [Formosa sp. S-31]|uniref:hybrid sensor histidine kinase/response regulator transcription factor n=1 Tax=Formosa sp. S-31 TaxID=2790949 RepID=UPI003EC063E8